MGNIMYDVTKAYAHKVIEDNPVLVGKTFQVYSKQSTALNPLQPLDSTTPRKMRGFTNIIYVDNAYLTFLSDSAFTVTPAYHLATLPDIDPDTGVTPNPSNYPKYLEYSLDRETWTVIGSKDQTYTSKHEHVYNPEFDPTFPSTSENPKFIENESGKYAIYVRGKMWDNCIFTHYAIDSNNVPTDSWKINGGSNVAIIGNFQTLLDYDDPPDEVGDFCAIAMFDRQTNITDISQLQLTATKLGEDCYGLMFANCDGLVDISGFRLDAPTIGVWSYEAMFGACEKLEKLPVITATKVLEGGCFGMFQLCGSLVNIDDWELPMTSLDINCYESMFDDCNALESARIKMPAEEMKESSCLFMFARCGNLVYLPDLPATKLAPWCYEQMFIYCAATVLPALPVTNLAEGCYYAMFFRSSELSDISSFELPATVLAESCYYSMFRECAKLVNAGLTLDAPIIAKQSYCLMFEKNSSLTTPPVINGTTCYDGGMASMFKDCTSLVTPPQLNITTLPDLTFFQISGTYYEAYPAMQYMFTGCTSLTSIPALPCTNLRRSYGCYDGMFAGCTSLVDLSTNVLPATVVSYSCYQRMFKGCTALEHPPAMYATNYTYSSVGSGTTQYPPDPEIPLPFMPCCYEMFANCTSLSSMPSGLELVRTGSVGCFSNMFKGCTALVEVPFGFLGTAIPAYAFESMFEGCTSLVKPLTMIYVSTINDHGCYRMFFGCTALENGFGVLDNLGGPSSIYTNACESMFENCSALKTIPILRSTFLRNNCYSRMFANCTNLEINTVPGVNTTVEWAIPYTGRLQASQTSLTGDQLTDMFLNISGNAPATPSANFALLEGETEETKPLVKYYQRQTVVNP